MLFLLVVPYTFIRKVQELKNSLLKIPSKSNFVLDSEYRFTDWIKFSDRKFVYSKQYKNKYT